MNKIKTVLTVALLSATTLLHAQTTTTVQNQLAPLPLNVSSVVNTNSGWGAAVGNTFGYLEGVPSTQAVVQVELFALRGATSHKIGVGLNIMTPINGTNSVFGAGVGIAYYNKSFYNATLNARLGDTYNVPFLKIPVYAYIESGGGYDISQNRAIAQAFTGATITYQINATWTATVGIAIGTVSDLPEYVEAIGGSATYHF